MFAGGFKSLEGLESSDLEDLRAAVASIQTALADAKRKTSRQGRRSKPQSNSAHDTGVEELLSTVEAWQLRPVYCERRINSIHTTNKVRLSEDGIARSALRALYEHVQSRHNPILTSTTEWTKQLEHLAACFCEHLDVTGTVGSDEDELWAPQEIEEPPLKDWTKFRDLMISPAPEPEEAAKAEAAKTDAKDESAFDNSEGYHYLQGHRTGMQMAQVVGLLIQGKQVEPVEQGTKSRAKYHTSKPSPSALDDAGSDRAVRNSGGEMHPTDIADFDQDNGNSTSKEKDGIGGGGAMDVGMASDKEDEMEARIGGPSSGDEEADDFLLRSTEDQDYRTRGILAQVAALRETAAAGHRGGAEPNTTQSLNEGQDLR